VESSNSNSPPGLDWNLFTNFTCGFKQSRISAAFRSRGTLYITPLGPTGWRNVVCMGVEILPSVS